MTRRLGLNPPPRKVSHSRTCQGPTRGTVNPVPICLHRKLPRSPELAHLSDSFPWRWVAARAALAPGGPPGRVGQPAGRPHGGGPQRAVLVRGAAQHRHGGAGRARRWQPPCGARPLAGAAGWRVTPCIEVVNEAQDGRATGQTVDSHAGVSQARLYETPEDVVSVTAHEYVLSVALCVMYCVVLR